MSTISVIVPAYNAEKTVLETITSVLNQTFSDFELIVVNDGSTDRTLELLSTVKDHRLKIFSYPNGGVPVARNRGLSHATGDFIAFLDADDLWTPDKLELQLATLQQHPDAGTADTTHFTQSKPSSDPIHQKIPRNSSIKVAAILNLISTYTIRLINHFSPRLSTNALKVIITY